MKTFFPVLLCIALFAMQSGNPAHASVVINGTRVIYPAVEREVSIRLTNNGTFPSLVQSWVDSGDSRQVPQDSDAPFLLMPPVTRIDPGKGQTLRLMAERVAQGREAESVFWLNVLEIPPAPSGEQAQQNTLQMAFRTRIKIFYRPAGLSQAGATQAPEQLQWRAVRDADGWALACSNPTRYHVSFNSVALVDTPYSNRQAGMVAPGATLLFPMQGLLREPAAGAGVKFESLNDYGSIVTHQAALQR
ncbi:molecular chaperone [Pseudomonas putida]|uniref:fimbrial biogenesis chaperone n=1 Tax=Pseudomonas putida TaxID=303 RepID=UPI00383AD760